MPALNIAATPNAMRAAPGPAGNAPAAHGNAEGESGNPFASVLSQQMNAPSAAPKQSAEGETGTSGSSPGGPAEAAADPTAAGLAALLPMLLGTVDAGGVAGEWSQRAKTTEAGESDTTPAELALALLAVPAAVGAANVPAAAVTSGTGQDGLPRGIPNAALARRTETTTMLPQSSPASTDTSADLVATNSPAMFAALADARAATGARADAAMTTAADRALATVVDKVEGETRPKSEPVAMQAMPAETTLPAQAMVPMHATAAAHLAAGDAGLRITTPLGSKTWEAAVGNSLVFLAGNQQNRAELVLTPPQLGRIEISLTMSGDQASALFVSANPAVRDALESALPRLREVLADAGITLGQAQIDSGSPQQSANDGQSGDNSRRSATTDFAGEASARAVAATAGTQWTQAARGLVDVFA